MQSAMTMWTASSSARTSSSAVERITRRRGAVSYTHLDVYKRQALYRGISNTAAARELAAAFDIPVNVPVTYREKREAEKIQRRRRELAVFIRRSRMYLTIYRGLLCMAVREQNEHFWEGLGSLSRVEYLLDCLLSLIHS